MKIKINKNNIDEYTKSVFNDVTTIEWLDHNFKLDKSVIENFPNLENLDCQTHLMYWQPAQEIDINTYSITTLEPLTNCTKLIKLRFDNNYVTTLEPLSRCINLTELYLKNNQISSLEILSKFPNLEILNCCDNKITTLKPLSKCLNLRDLNCRHNLLTTLEPLSSLTNLEKINCCNNSITSLKPLSRCVMLQKIRCNENKITTLKPLSKCFVLKELYCDQNKIVSLDGLSNCTMLQNLSCSFNKITTIEPLRKCSELQILECSGNQISGIEYWFSCKKIHWLYCFLINTSLSRYFPRFYGTVRIKTLEPLSECTKLKELYCCFNQIATLEDLTNCINLEVLRCYCNQIVSLYGLSNCTNLRSLHCDNNKITTLEDLTNGNIHTLTIDGNQITSLEPITNFANLQILSFTRNQITSLAPLIYLQRLRLIYYTDNPCDVQPVQVARFLNRITTNRGFSIYKDGQNIHDGEIQRSVCESIQALLMDSKPIFSTQNILDSELSNKTKEALIEYCQDQTVHTLHLITYEELLSYVWQRIIKSEHNEQLFKILEEQIADSECMCFTGRFNRTLSVLVGFYDDIKINISNKSRISAIILNCRDKILPYDINTHQKLAEKELIDAGYTNEEIKDWIDAIMETEEND